MFDETWKQSWQFWKRGFDAWEKATSRYAETVLRSPAVLAPAGSVVTAVSKAQAQREKMMSTWWSLWGLPTRQEQERSLHALQQMSSRIIDLQEELEELRQRVDQPVKR